LHGGCIIYLADSKDQPALPLDRWEVIMKNRWLFALMAWLVATLSCSLPTQQTSWTDITSLTVTPVSGEKDFSLEVKYNYTWDRERPNAEIYCMYTTPSGRTIPVGTLVPTVLDRDREAFSKTAKLAFTIKPKDGKIEPGVYLAGCASGHDSSLKTATFTVTESATPTLTPPEEPAAIPIQTPSMEAASPVTTTFTPTPVPVSRWIIFDFAKVKSSRPGAGGELSRVTNLCVPEVSLDPLGNLSGQCEKLHIAALLTDESITVQFAGRVDATGNFSFLYDISEIGTPNGAWRISYLGRGKFTSGGQASGIAAFSFSCNSGADNLIWCGKQTSESFSGTIPWSFVPAK
jgi:hypothetical protein